ncbi:MAG: hypothetical protein M3126_10840 [Candidatus Eremiobacteraeota bacterium]|nr:hypothetical protein [Candidatus Eremiobacteraeota bacterium]
MDISSIASGLAAASTAASIDTSVLKSVDNLAQDQVSRLFANLGLGQNVNTYA